MGAMQWENEEAAQQESSVVVPTTELEKEPVEKKEEPDQEKTEEGEKEEQEPLVVNTSIDELEKIIKGPDHSVPVEEKKGEPIETEKQPETEQITNDQF